MKSNPAPPPDPLTAPVDDEPIRSTTASAPVAVAAAESSTASFDAQARRQEAWLDRNDWSFQGRPLEAWSMERDSLLARLIEADVPAPKLSSIAYYEERLRFAREQAETNGTLAEIQHITLETLLDVVELYPTAGKLLYLASHKPEAWDHLRGRERVGRFLRTIEEWAEVNIPAGDPWSAVLLARDIDAKYELVRAQRRPYHTLRNLVGN